MLGTRDFAINVNVSCFLVAVTDKCGGQSNEAPVTTVITQYGRLITGLFRRNRRPGLMFSVLIRSESNI